MSNLRFTIVSALGFAALSGAALASPALNGNGQVQEGEAGNKLGATAAAALGLPGAQERLDAQVHNPGMTQPSSIPEPSPPEQTSPPAEPTPQAEPAEAQPSQSGPDPEPAPTPDGGNQ